MPSSHLILCCPLLLLASIPPSIRVFSNESAVRMRWPNCWSFSFNISPSVNTQDCSPLGWPGWISLQSKGLSRVLWDKEHAQMSGKLPDFMSTGTWVYQIIVPFPYSLSPPIPPSFVPSFFLTHLGRHNILQWI